MPTLYAIVVIFSIVYRKHNKTRSYNYFWLKRYDGTLESAVLKQVREQARAILNSADDPASQTKPKTDVDGQIARIEDAKLALG